MSPIEWAIGLIAIVAGVASIIISLLAVLRSWGIGPSWPAVIFVTTQRAFEISVALAVVATILMSLVSDSIPR